MKLFITIGLICLCAFCLVAQDKNAVTGASLKGKVRDDNGKNLSGVSVVLRQGEAEIKSVTTDKNGEFTFDNIPPGTYNLTLSKKGYSTANLKEDIILRAGDKIQMKDRLSLSINEGELALIKISVFTTEGRIAAGVKVELVRVDSDGSTKKIGSGVTGGLGQCSFRLPPSPAQYRAIAKISGNPVSEMVNVDGPAVYRTAIQIQSR
jgi:5-hydroxyisourate hydrolase-like protein (transthyretin family)